MPKEKSDIGRKYKKEWEKKYMWLKCSEDKKNAYCTYCKCNVLPKLYNISVHEKSKKHQDKFPSTRQSTLDKVLNLSTSDNTKKAEIELSLAIACHSSIRAVDHIGEVVKEHGKNSILGGIQLHRTKCISIIENVIAASLKEELKNNMEGKKFILMVDEATDIAIQKHLCIVVRFFCNKNNKIQTAFLGLKPVVETKAEVLFKEITEELALYNQTLKNCVGFASDGAAAMVGCNNSLWTRIKNENSNCIQMKCVCHSLALCVQHSFSKLPANLGFLLSEIPMWFSNSNIRREDFKTLFKVMNATENDNQERQAPLPFMKLSKTRWLVRGKILSNILLNWEELLAYFTCCKQSAGNDTLYKARLIKEMLQDRINYFYFAFATPVVKEFERINVAFQQTNADPYDLANQLCRHNDSLHQRLYNKDKTLRILENVDFGELFAQEISTHMIKFINSPNKDLELNKIKCVKLRCQAMLQEALNQVTKRLPDTVEVFKGISRLNPTIILSQTEKEKFSNLPFFFLINDVDVVEDQYRKISLVAWNEEKIFKDHKIPKEALEFWLGVSKHDQFKELSNYALTCLIVPPSNAIVERIFSYVTSIKTKPRNRMQINLLDSIVRIRSFLSDNNICCHNFKSTPDMIKRHNSKNLYSDCETKKIEAKDIQYLEEVLSS